MAQEAEGQPIQSNIQHTVGANAHLQPPSDMEMDSDFGDSNDAIFDEEDGDSLNGDWGSIHSSSDHEPFAMNNALNDNSFNPKGADRAVIGMNDENPLAEGKWIGIGNGGAVRPQIGSEQQRCWLCSECNAINNLMETLKSESMRCARCPFAYRPNAAIIYSADWDHCDGLNPIQNGNDGNGGNGGNMEIHTVWCCPVCTLQNAMEWPQCDGCGRSRPHGDALEISYSYSAVKRIGGVAAAPNRNFGDLNLAQNQNEKLDLKLNSKRKRGAKRRAPRIENIGIPRKMAVFPKCSENMLYEQRLLDVFGRPFRNKLVAPNRANRWTVDCDVMHCRLEWTSYSEDARR